MPFEYDAGALMKIISDTVGARVNNELRDIGLTVAQARFLVFMHHRSPRPVSMHELESAFSISQPTVTGTVQRLVSKGFVQVESDPSDRRAKLVSLTPKGQAIARDGDEHRLSVAERLLEPLDDAERATLLDLLTRINNSLSR